MADRTSISRHPAGFAVVAVTGVIAAFATAFIFEATTDRDWSIGGWEWPETITLALLLSLVAAWALHPVVSRFRARHPASLRERSGVSEHLSAPHARGAPYRRAKGRALAKKVVPGSIRSRVNNYRNAHRDAAWSKPRDLGDLRRTTPLSTWGHSRGGSIPRVYISEFIEQHAADIRGRALEIASDRYIAQYGRGVTQTDLLDINPDNPKATFVANFGDAASVPDNTFDCLVITQVLSWIYDPWAGLRTAHRILAPGGVMLATTPGTHRIAPIEKEFLGQWFHYTSMSAKRAAEDVFGEGNVDVQAYGNVLTAAGTLFGLGLNDVTTDELAVHDPDFEVVIGIRAVKRL
jgi:SAM-dependent methyltransferase